MPQQETEIAQALLASPDMVNAVRRVAETDVERMITSFVLPWADSDPDIESDEAIPESSAPDQWEQQTGLTEF